MTAVVSAQDSLTSSLVVAIRPSIGISYLMLKGVPPVGMTMAMQAGLGVDVRKDYVVRFTGAVNQMNTAGSNDSASAPYTISLSGMVGGCFHKGNYYLDICSGASFVFGETIDPETVEYTNGWLIEGLTYVNTRTLKRFSAIGVPVEASLMHCKKRTSKGIVFNANINPVASYIGISFLIKFNVYSH